MYNVYMYIDPKKWMQRAVFDHRTSGHLMLSIANGQSRFATDPLSGFIGLCSLPHGWDHSDFHIFSPFRHHSPLQEMVLIRHDNHI